MRQFSSTRFALLSTCLVVALAAGCAEPEPAPETETAEAPEASAAPEIAVTPAMERAGAAIDAEALRNHIT